VGTQVIQMVKHKNKTKAIFFNKRLVKLVISVFITLILLSGFSVGAYAGINYAQAKKLLNEGNSLILIGKFDDALDKLALAESKWVSIKLKSEASISIKLAQGLVEDKSNFEKALKYYDEGNWQKAKEYFVKVSAISRYSEEVKEKLVIIEGKVQETSKMQVKYVTAKTNTPTPSASPVLETDLNQICENEMNIYKNNLLSKLTIATLNNPDYQMIAGTRFKAAVDADIIRGAENAAYQFYNDCLAGNKRLKDMTY